MDYEIIKENSSHYICICPSCNNSKPKFYVSKDEGKGFCFHCNYSITDPDMALNNMLEGKELEEKVILKTFSLDMIPELNDVGHQYLSNRRLSDGIIQRYNFRSYNIWNQDCVFIPNKIENNKTDFFQLRFTGESKLRYYTAKATKPLFGLQGLIGTDTLMLCEGIFTAIGASDKISVDCISLLGKFLSSHQEMQLKGIVDPYKEIVVGLDSMTYSESYKLSRHLLQLFPEKQISMVLLPDGEDDYDDLSQQKAVDYYNNRIRLSSTNDLGFLKVLNNIRR